jgi:hypothetical protein
MPFDVLGDIEDDFKFFGTLDMLVFIYKNATFWKLNLFPSLGMSEIGESDRRGPLRRFSVIPLS